MDENSVIGNDVDCYSVAPVSIGRNAVVSQYAHICTASHDYRRLDFPTITGHIEIGPEAWVAAGAFLSPGVKVGEGAVVGAHAVVTKCVPAWTVVAGNPAQFVSRRSIGELTRQELAQVR
jgi:putative colanic acid biosynthesis acetyltransferase WcaF